MIKKIKPTAFLLDVAPAGYSIEKSLKGRLKKSS